MKIEKIEGTMESAHSKKLTELLLKDGTLNTVAKIDYVTSFEAFENMAEIKAANAYPADDVIVDAVNNKRKAAARQKEMTKQLDDLGIVKPDIKNDVGLRFKKMYDIFIATGSTHNEARAETAAALKAEWPEGL
jgi:hypothetical protein